MMGRLFFTRQAVPWTGSSFSQDMIFCEIGHDFASSALFTGGEKACRIHSIHWQILLRPSRWRSCSLCSIDPSVYPTNSTVCVCVFSSHPFWTSSSLDVPAGVTQEEGHTRFLIHLPSAVRALIFVARRIQPFLSLVDREVEFCVLTN